MSKDTKVKDIVASLDLSDEVVQALTDLARMRNLHSAVVEFSLGDSAAKELGRERVTKDNVPLPEANAIGSYIVGSAFEELESPWDDRTIKEPNKTTGKHRVMLDLDVPHVYIPSSTEGHGHLIIDVPVMFHDLVRLLNLMYDIGIIQSGFAAATSRRGETWLRAPGVSKYDMDTEAI